MKSILLTIIGLGLCLGIQGKTYYVASGGNDAHQGTSPGQAWRTLDKANAAKLQPGDKLLFHSGDLFDGQLHPQGQGAPGKPIVISSYGGTARPVINIGDREGAGIRITNQSWIEISNMEITSGAAPKLGIGRQGIVAIADHRPISHIFVSGCYIHDIWGQLGGDTEYCGYNSCGILVKNRPDWGKDLPELTDVRVTNNRIERFDKCGIIVLGCKERMYVAHNYIEDTGGDGIFCGGCDKGIIEYNTARRTCLRSGYQDLVGGEKWWPHTAAIWIQNAVGAVMQYNAVYDTGRQPGNGDGEAYDFDFNCIKCIAQYNYSENNHGFMLIMNKTQDNVARYNLSVNDQSHLVQLQCNYSEGNVFHNNVFYIDYGTADIDLFRGNDGSVPCDSLGAYFYNNIFYSTGQSCFRTVYTQGEVLKRSFDETTAIKQGAPGKLFYHNCYYGRWKNGLPNDPEALIKDPMMVLPGAFAGTDGVKSTALKNYRLKAGSPCKATGLALPEKSMKNFFGEPVATQSPNFGIE